MIFSKLLSDADNIADNLRDYINGFSKAARDIIEYFDFDKQIDKMERRSKGLHRRYTIVVWAQFLKSI